MTRLPDPGGFAPASGRARVDGHEQRYLSEGWRAARAPLGLREGDEALDTLRWIPARVPGTAAAAMHDAHLWRPGDSHDFDSEDWWFRTRFEAEPGARGEEVLLCLDGIATVSEVYLNGELLLQGDSMFEAHAVDVGSRLRTVNELSICCRALEPLLHVRRRPRARWRTRLVADGNLRFFRTMLLGRAPGFAPGPAAVGPWRGVRIERRRRLAVEQLLLRSRMSGENGVLSAVARLRSLDGPAATSIELELDTPSGAHRASLSIGARDDDNCATAEGELVVPDVARWWPHTHGEPVLHDARLVVTTGSGLVTVCAGRVGFRSLAFGPSPAHDVEQEGLDLHVNGVRVFARGAVWTPIDAIGLAPSPSDLRAALERVRDAGMNILRLPGTSAYETSAFHNLCDEMGILVWQDFMFANLDYPVADERFRETVEREVVTVLGDLGGRASLAVLCGNSEVEQQVAMLGLDPALGRGELFGAILPALIRDATVDAAYLPSTPCGGELPFHPDHGVANYYGVGGYRRGLEDARLAGVRFAAECLAFSNVPEEQTIERMNTEAGEQLVVQHPRWKAGVPRDAGAGWDFEDVRDHYLRMLYGLDPVELRRVDHARYLALSRMVTGEVMAEVFGEWRRSASPCGGGIVLWLQDLLPGAGWGLLDDRGEPKAAYHHLRRLLAPISVWTTDEGLAGGAIHVANDRPAPLRACLRVALYRDFEQRVGEAREPIELAPHGACERNIEKLTGRFTDVTWAYRFGPPAQDLIVASLERTTTDGLELLSQAVRFPVSRPSTLETAGRLGLDATARESPDEIVRVAVRSQRFAHGVRVQAPGYRPHDDVFPIEPGGERVVLLHPCEPGAEFAGAMLTAVNLDGAVRIGREVESA
jgi:beta-mannosidase